MIINFNHNILCPLKEHFTTTNPDKAKKKKRMKSSCNAYVKAISFIDKREVKKRQADTENEMKIE